MSTTSSSNNTTCIGTGATSFKEAITVAEYILQYPSKLDAQRFFNINSAVGKVLLDTKSNR